MEDIEALARQSPGSLRRMNRVRAAIVRRAGLLLLLAGVVMVPWSVYIFRSLPRRSLATHYDLAWGGFDVALTAALLWTAGQALLRTRWLPASAAATATLLVVDAWFDVVTSQHGGPRRDAVLSAVIAELPLALGCLWLSVNAQHLQESAMVVRLKERRRRRRNSPPA